MSTEICINDAIDPKILYKGIKKLEDDNQRLMKAVGLTRPVLNDKRGIITGSFIKISFWSSALLYILVETKVIENKAISTSLAIIITIFALFTVVIVQYWLSTGKVIYNQPRHTSRAALIMAATVAAILLLSDAIALLVMNFNFYAYYEIDYLSYRMSKKKRIKEYNEAIKSDANYGAMASHA